METIDYQCICSSHPGQSLIQKSFDLNLNDLFNSIFEDGGSQVIIETHKKMNTKDIKFDKWTYLNNDKNDSLSSGLLSRTIHYTFCFTAGLFGSLNTPCIETQSIKYRDPKQYIVECISKTPNVPYGNNFFIKNRYCFIKVNVNKTILKLHSEVKFIKKQVFSDTIRNTSINGVLCWSIALTDFLEKKAEEKKSLIKTSKVLSEIENNYLSLSEERENIFLNSKKLYGPRPFEDGEKENTQLVSNSKQSLSKPKGSRENTIHKKEKRSEQSIPLITQKNSFSQVEYKILHDSFEKESLKNYSLLKSSFEKGANGENELKVDFNVDNIDHSGMTAPLTTSSLSSWEGTVEFQKRMEYLENMQEAEENENIFDGFNFEEEFNNNSVNINSKKNIFFETQHNFEKFEKINKGKKTLLDDNNNINNSNHNKKIDNVLSVNNQNFNVQQQESENFEIVNNFTKNENVYLVPPNLKNASNSLKASVRHQASINSFNFQNNTYFTNDTNSTANISENLALKNKKKIKVVRMPGRWIHKQRNPERYMSHPGRSMMVHKFDGIIGTIFLINDVISPIL
ncbi:Protein Aster-C, partial [Clydaea vesicula]